MRTLSHIFVLLIASTLLLGSRGASAAPIIDVWYGTPQRFGHIGDAQPFVNIVGNVSDASGIQSLSYSLNGGAAVALSVGPDGRRLIAAGDFNADIATSLLDPMPLVNTLVITAVSTDTSQSQVTVDIEYENLYTWPLPYSTDWSSAILIEDQVQITDGLWAIESNGLRTTLPGYDRAFIVGDQSWQDVEVTVPVTIFTLDSKKTHIGTAHHWKGNSDSPDLGIYQPKTGWEPVGAFLWYRHDKKILQISEDKWSNYDRPMTLQTGTTYWFKTRVQADSSGGNVFSVKVWETGQSEPTDWQVVYQESANNPTTGSVWIYSVSSDVRFGNVDAIDISNSNIPPLARAGVDQTVETNQSFTLDASASSDVDGTISSYTWRDASGIIGTGSSITHAYASAGTYEIILEVMDNNGTLSSDALTISAETNLGNNNGIDSDDFSSGVLNTAIWTFVDPQNDATLSFTGAGTSDAWAVIDTPGGSAHDPWQSGILAPHIVQSVNNANFEVVVKFESPITTDYQIQGLLVKEDNTNFLRFDFYHDGNTTRAYGAIVENLVGTAPINTTVPLSLPMYLRVIRQNTTWDLSYSADGSSWTSAGSFTYDMTMTEIGIHSSNAGSPVPAHTTQIDYFESADDPINDDAASTVPDPVVPIAPMGSVSNASPTFEWQDGGDAELYRLLVYDKALGTTVHLDNYPVASICSGGTCSVTPAGLTLNYSADHFWRVRAYNSVGWNDWTSPVYFDYLPSTPPVPVVPIAPMGAVSTASPAFEWQDAGDADQYRLLVYDKALGTTVHLTNYPVASVCSGGTCSVTPTGLSMNIGANHFWRIRAYNSAGWNDWTSPVYFDYLPSTPPVPVVPIAPMGAVSTASPAFEWQDAGDADLYRLLVYDKALGTTVHLANYPIASICSGGACSVTPAGLTLNYSTDHFWRVRAYNSAGWNDWTSPVYFDYLPSTPPVPVVPIAPMGAVSTASPAFEWQDAGDADLYRLLVYDNALGTTVHLDNYPVASVCSGGTCSLTPAGLSLNFSANHFWRIKAYNSAGWNSWTSPVYFDYLE